MRRAPVPVYLWLAGGSAALYWLVFTLNLVYQVKVIGLSPLQLVLVGTVLEASVFIGEVPTGIVADVYSRRLSILIGLVLIGAGLALGAVPSFAAVLVAQVLWGVGYTFTSGAQQAWITDEIGTERIATVFVRSTQVEMVGTIVGIVLAGALGLVWIGLPIVLGGAGFVALAAVLAVTMPEHGFTPTRSADRTTFATMARQFREGLALARRRRVVRTLMLVSLIGGLASEAFDRLWVVHVLDVGLPTLLFGASDEVVWFAAIALTGALLSLIVSLAVNRVFPRTLANLHPTRLMAALTGVQVVAVAVFAFSGHFWVALAMVWVQTAAQRVAEPVSSAWMNRHVESGVRATVLSFEGQMNAVGQIVGGPALGAVGSAVSVRAALLGSAITLLPAAGLYAGTRSDDRTADQRGAGGPGTDKPATMP
jgi:MFS transporter, DHA3 family, tetracycline resistance protein